MGEAVHKCIPEPLSVDTVFTKMVDALSFTVPVAKFVKHKIDKKNIDKVKTEEGFVKLAETVEKKKIKIEYRIPTKRIDWV